MNFFWHLIKQLLCRRHFCRILASTVFITITFFCLVAIIRNSRSGRYVVVVESEMNTTWMHIHTFGNNLSPENYKEVAVSFPGLFECSNVMLACIGVVEEMLQFAMKRVPQSQWSSTPIAFKISTLQKPDVKWNEILTRVLHKSSFLVKKNAVSYINESSKRIFEWYSLNFILGRLHFWKSSAALVNLERGLALTFAVNAPDIFTYNSDIYTIADPFEIRQVFDKKFFNTSLDVLQKLDVYQYPSCGSVYFPICQRIISEEVVGNIFGSVPIEDLQYVDIYVFGDIYKKALNLKFFEKESGGSVLVRYFKNLAKKYCSIPDKKTLINCLEMLYFSAIFEDALRLDPNKKLYFSKFDKSYLHWSAGQAYILLKY